jgi:hypothetical protein
VNHGMTLPCDSFGMLMPTETLHKPMQISSTHHHEHVM